jgi:hypothetical protein
MEAELLDGLSKCKYTLWQVRYWRERERDHEQVDKISGEGRTEA